MSTARRSDEQIRAVIDTNVIVSGLMFNGNERLVLNLAGEGRFAVYLSPPILDEVRAVLPRKFHHSIGQAEERISEILSWATVVEPSRSLSIVERNDADNRILECCLECRADYLVAGDRRDLLPLATFGGLPLSMPPRSFAFSMACPRITEA